MALTVVWEKMSVDRPDGSNLILKRGEGLPDFVDDFHRTVFTMIGAVKDTGAAVAVVQAAADAEFEEQPLPPLYPPEVPPVQPAPQRENVDPVAVVPATPSPEAPAVKPSVSDNKDAWEAYAVGRGYMSQTEAEALTKTKLMTEVNKRESVA